MSDESSKFSQHTTGSGASGAGDGDEGWQQQRHPRQRKGGSPSASGDSRATKSTVPTKVLVVPEKYAKGGVSWVRNLWKGSPMEAHLKGYTDSRKTLSRILLVGAEAEKCALLLVAKVKNWSEQKQEKRRGATGAAYVSPGARIFYTLDASPDLGKSALMMARDGSAVHFTEEEGKGGKTFKFSLAGGSKEQQEAVVATATELVHQMSRELVLKPAYAGLAIAKAKTDYKDQTGEEIDIKCHYYRKGESRRAFVLSSNGGVVDAVLDALRHYAEEISAEQAEFLRMYLAGKFALVPMMEVLKKQHWSDRFTIHKSKHLPSEVAEKHRPKDGDGFVFVMFPDTEKGFKCLKKARELTKRHLDEKKEEAKSGGGAAKKSSPPKTAVSAVDYFTEKAKGETTKGCKAKVFRSRGRFDVLADEAGVDPTRTATIVVPTEKKSPKGPQRVRVEYSVGLTPDDTVRDRTQKKRKCKELKFLSETARKECSEQFVKAAKTAAPQGSAWSAMAKKAPEVKKVEQDELPTPVTVVCKQTKTVKPVKSTEEEKWQVEEDYDHWNPPSTPIGHEEETSGWNM